METKNKARIIEKVIKAGFIIAFFFLFFIQATVFNPFLNKNFNADYVFEGTLLGYEETLYCEGSLTLHLRELEMPFDHSYGSEKSKKNGDPSGSSNGIKLLLNGDAVYDFKEGAVELAVKDGDVVGIDASAASVKAEITIYSKSSNVINDCVGESYLIESGIENLLKAQVN